MVMTEKRLSSIIDLQSLIRGKDINLNYCDKLVGTEHIQEIVEWELDIK